MTAPHRTLLTPLPSLVVPCDACNGSGYRAAPHVHASPDDCPDCGEAPDCESCDGTGEVASVHACRECWSASRDIRRAVADGRCVDCAEPA
jgi:DnaJ-class molecular chaperone